MQENINIPDSNITTNLTFRQLVLMNMQQLTNFPYIEKDFDALTDYELLCLVVKFLNDVIANQNEQNDSITRMYESFLALQDYVNDTKDELEDAFNNLDDYVRNYFENLDVQDEINNKLDKMLEDGVLEQIIEQYLNSKAVFCFDTIADLKASTNLTDGSEVRLLGNTSYNDGVDQLFLVTTRTVDDVDGVNDTIVINDNLVAKRIKVKNNLPLNPNITSDEEIKNLHIVNENTGSGTAGITFDGQENVTISHSNIEGGYWSARIGNENDSSTTKNIKLINNKLTSNYGISLRHKKDTDISDNGNHSIVLNEVNNLTSHPGIESWAENVNILFNNIKNISGSVGGTGGITVGGRNYNIVDGNKIENYAYGIEVGNSKLNIISNCIVKNCATGIICSSAPTSDIIIDNCIVMVRADGRGIEFASSSAHRIKVSNCIFIYGDTAHSWNDENSRSGVAIYTTSGGKNITFDNCSFINSAQVQCYGNSKFNNCNFVNCNNLYVNKDASFTNCHFKDCKISIISNNEGLFPSFNSCTFELSSGVTIYGNYLINGGSDNAVAKFTNCNTINCNINSQVGDSTAGGNNIRFKVQFIDGIGYTFNKAQLSDIITSLSNNNITLNKGTKIVDNYNNKVWELLTQNRQISYQATVPTTGAFVKGDRIYNNMTSSSTVDYWICTTTGTFGTETAPVFVAKNV